MAKKQAKVEFYLQENGEFSWRLKAPNGKIVAVPGEGFETMDTAEDNFKLNCLYTNQALIRHYEDR